MLTFLQSSLRSDKKSEKVLVKAVWATFPHAYPESLSGLMQTNSMYAV